MISCIANLLGKFKSGRSPAVDGDEQRLAAGELHTSDANAGHTEAMKRVARALKRTLVPSAAMAMHEDSRTADQERIDTQTLQLAFATVYGIPRGGIGSQQHTFAQSKEFIFGRQPIFKAMPALASALAGAMGDAKQKVECAIAVLLGANDVALQKSAVTIGELFGVAPERALHLFHPLAHQLIRMGGLLNYLLSSSWDNVGVVKQGPFGLLLKFAGGCCPNEQLLLFNMEYLARYTPASVAMVVMHECAHAAALTRDHFYLTDLCAPVPLSRRASPRWAYDVNLTAAQEKHRTIADPTRGHFSPAFIHLLEGKNSEAFTQSMKGASLPDAVARFHSDEATRVATLLHNSDTLVLAAFLLSEL